MKIVYMLIMLHLCVSCGNPLKYLHQDVERAKFIPLALAQNELPPGSIVDDIPMVVSLDSMSDKCFPEELRYIQETTIPKRNKMIKIDLTFSAGVTDFLNESYVDGGIQVDFDLDFAESVQINYGRAVIEGIYIGSAEEHYLSGQMPDHCKRALIIKKKPLIRQNLKIESLIYKFFRQMDGEGAVHVDLNPKLAQQIVIGGELGIDYVITENYNLEILSPMIIGYRLAKFSLRKEVFNDYLIWTGAHQLKNRGKKHRYEDLSQTKAKLAKFKK